MDWHSRALVGSSTQQEILAEPFWFLDVIKDQVSDVLNLKTDFIL